MQNNQQKIFAFEQVLTLLEIYFLINIVLFNISVLVLALGSVSLNAIAKKDLD